MMFCIVRGFKAVWFSEINCILYSLAYDQRLDVLKQNEITKAISLLVKRDRKSIRRIKSVKGNICILKGDNSVKIVFTFNSFLIRDLF